MRTLDATFTVEKNKEENRPIYLYTVFDYDDADTNLTLAEWDVNVVYDGVTYTKFPITHDFVGENANGATEQVRVKVSNVSRLIQGYLESYDWRKKKVTIQMVWADQLADATAYTRHTFYIDSYSCDENAANFILTPKFNVIDLHLPGRKYSRNYCGWRFKGTECAYSGGESTCNKTLSRCRVLANQLRFGGFPSIPSRRIYIR